MYAIYLTIYTQYACERCLCLYDVNNIVMIVMFMVMIMDQDHEREHDHDDHDHDDV